MLLQANSGIGADQSVYLIKGVERDRVAVHVGGVRLAILLVDKDEQPDRIFVGTYVRTDRGSKGKTLAPAPCRIKNLLGSRQNHVFARGERRHFPTCRDLRAVDRPARCGYDSSARSNAVSSEFEP